MFLEQLSLSTSGCEELLLGPLGAAVGRKREERSSKFSPKFSPKLLI